MSSPNSKRRRACGTGMGSDKASASHTDELKRFMGEMEPVTSQTTSKKSSQPLVIGHRPTYRAVLAHRGYLVRNSLGCGTYSKVKLAVDCTDSDEDHQERVAVKIIDRLKAPKDYQNRFLPRELDIWPKLKHKNIIRLRETFEDARRVYMVLDYARGGDALKYIQKSGAISENMARTWTLQIADAVSYMHSLHIAHRDLKLENLLLDEERNIKICDFGFVKEIAGNSEGMSSLSRTYCGSKSYAAPEILKGNPYDPKQADVWAASVILYIFVTGKMPFDESKGTKSILSEQEKLNFPWPKLKKISSDCKELIKYMFTWEFSERPKIKDVMSHQWFHPPADKSTTKQRVRSELAGMPTSSEDGTLRGTNIEYSLKE